MKSRIINNYITTVLGMIIILSAVIQFVVGNFGWLLTTILTAIGVILLFCTDKVIKKIFKTGG